MNNFLKRSVLPFIIVGIVLGIIFSFFFPVWLVRVFVTFNSIFSNFLGFFIPLLIIGLVAPAISDLGKGAGRLLLITLVIAYLSTVFSGLLAYLTGISLFPRILDTGRFLSGLDMSETITPYFTVGIPSFIDVTSALVLAFVLGLGCLAVKGESLKNVLEDFRGVIVAVIHKVIIPLLPVYIFGIFLKMGAEGVVFSVLGMFVRIILIILALHFTVLILQFVIAGSICHKKPFSSLITMFPAYVTALGTSSSAATIPATLHCVKKLGVNPDIADFSVPLCANVHMPCSILKIVSCTVAISLVMGLPTDFPLFIEFILMLAITMVAAPGVPGGAVMASLPMVASILGFNSDMQGLLIAIYMAMDSIGTAGNVTGDGAIALVLDKINSKRKK